MTTPIDYGPLTTLIGTWRGDKGMDIAPDPEGTEENPYFETLTFTPTGIATNANQQVLAGLRYHQVVSRVRRPAVRPGGLLHVGAATGTVMQSLLIPRAVGLVAGGKYVARERAVVLEVEAAVDSPDWNIVQSPFMRDNARTVGFRHRITVDGGTLAYDETTIVDIYGKRFEHTDTNTLTRA